MLGASALALVTYALIEAAGGAVVVAAAARGVVAGVAFVLVERQRADPMLPLASSRPGSSRRSIW